MLSSNKQTNRIYSGRRSGASRTVTSMNPLETTKGKLNRWNSGLTKGYTGGSKKALATSVINSGNGGRDLKKPMTPVVRKRTAKDFA